MLSAVLRTCCPAPQQFWSRLAGSLGSKFYWTQRGEADTIMDAVNVIGARACLAFGLPLQGGLAPFWAARSAPAAQAPLSPSPLTGASAACLSPPQTCACASPTTRPSAAWAT